MGSFKSRLALIACLWVAFGLLLGFGLTRSWQGTWTTFGINAQPAPFSDIRNIPQSIEIQKSGGDPYGPRPDSLNYPRVWMVLFTHLDLSNHIIAFELVMIGFYLGSLSHLIFTTPRVTTAVLLLVAGLSSVSLLAVERGNNDLSVFVLTYLAAQTSIAAVAVLLILLAAILKLYPALALIGKGITERKQQWMFTAGIVLVGLYLFTQRLDIAKIRRNTPHVFRQSYGVNSMTFAAQARFPLHSVHALLMTLALVLFATCFVWGRALAPLNPSPSNPSDLGRSRILFLVFSSIFIGTFLFTPNYEYRLIFLIPTLPFYAELLEIPRLRLVAVVSLILLIISLDSHILHGSIPLKVAGHLARACMFLITSVFAGWVSEPYLSEFFKLSRLKAEAERASVL